MRRSFTPNLLTLLLTALLAALLTASLAGCLRAYPGSESTRQSTNTAVTATSTALTQTTSPLTPTPASTGNAPQASPAALTPTAAASLSPETTRTLSYFPLQVGNSWIYRLEAGTTDCAAEKMTHAWIMTDTVVELRRYAPYAAARIQHDVILTQGTAADAPVFDLTRPGEFWYIINGDQVYRQPGEPDWQSTGSGTLLFTFPLGAGSQAAGPKRLTLPAGPLESCYTLTTAGGEQAFCLGLGIASDQGQDAGFAYRYELTGYLLQD